MPWIDRTAAILEAWYPGQKGGEAIAGHSVGRRQPLRQAASDLPESEAQLPHPTIQGDPKGAPNGPVGRAGHYGRIFDGELSAKARDVGYKWCFARGERPLFPFGYGLSYTSFGFGLKASVNGTRVRFARRSEIRARRPGVATPQFYCRWT